ncbi:MAG: YcgL domain-containing protein [Pseudomonadota bacterium]
MRSKKKADTYLYVPEGAEYDSLPEALRDQFGEAEAFLTFELTAQRTLALTDTQLVLQALEEQGFYLQMPVDPNKVNQLIRETPES